MLEALSHRLVPQVARVDALQHVTERRSAQPGTCSPPIQLASRDARGIPGRVLVTGMIYRIVERTERKILAPHLWTLLEC